MQGYSAKENQADRGGFNTTHWSVICACAREENVDPIARTAFCRSYWPPVYLHLRRLGHNGHDAQDLTQSFFEFILARPWFGVADPKRGKFRNFLLASLHNFLKSQREWHSSSKRGGKYTRVFLDLTEVESHYAAVSQLNSSTPETSFDAEWAATIARLSLRRLETEYKAGHSPAVFAALKGYLAKEGSADAYAATAQALGASEGSVKVGVHRLRKRYGAILREEVARTVAAEDVGEELNHLRAALASAML